MFSADGPRTKRNGICIYINTNNVTVGKRHTKTSLDLEKCFLHVSF